jgi:putative addiction module antidote
MTMKTKVRKIGNSYGILLPKEALHAMKVKEGSVLYLTEAPRDSLRITPADEQFERTMHVAERGIHRYRNALRELAK